MAKVTKSRISGKEASYAMQPLRTDKKALDVVREQT
jgi:hypothetical protein